MLRKGQLKEGVEGGLTPTEQFYSIGRLIIPLADLSTP